MEGIAMSDRRDRSGATQRRKAQSEVAEVAYEYTSKLGWDRFDEAVYEYAQECALMELEQEGYVGPPGDVQWAHEHMLSFFFDLDEDVFREFDLDRDYILEAAEHRFVVEFRSAWGVARGLLSEELDMG